MPTIVRESRMQLVDLPTMSTRQKSLNGGRAEQKYPSVTLSSDNSKFLVQYQRLATS